MVLVIYLNRLSLNVILNHFLFLYFHSSARYYCWQTVGACFGRMWGRTCLHTSQWSQLGCKFRFSLLFCELMILEAGESLMGKENKPKSLKLIRFEIGAIKINSQPNQNFILWCFLTEDYWGEHTSGYQYGSFIFCLENRINKRTFKTFLNCYDSKWQRNNKKVPS